MFCTCCRISQCQESWISILVCVDGRFCETQIEKECIAASMGRHCNAFFKSLVEVQHAFFKLCVNGLALAVHMAHSKGATLFVVLLIQNKSQLA